MKPTPIINMFSGTGDGLNEFTGFQSFPDNYGPGRSGRGGGPNLQTWVHEGNRPSPLDSTLWTNATGLPEPRLKDDEGRLNAAFVEWLMGLPSAHAVGLSRTASIRLAGNAVVRLQARLTAINNEGVLK